MPSPDPVIRSIPRGTTRAMRVRDLLRELILAGHFTNDLLPSEQELMLQYAGSRATVRDALQMLREEHLVERRQGTGTFVVRRKSFHPFDRLHGISQAARRLSRRTHSRLVIEQVAAQPPIAEFFRIDRGSPCLVIEFDTDVGHEPYSTAVSYLPIELADRLPAERQFDGDFYDFLAAAGATVQTGDLLVEAVNADAHSARRLKVTQGTALMLFRRRMYGPGGTPLEMGFIRCRGDQLTLVTRLPGRAVD